MERKVEREEGRGREMGGRLGKWFNGFMDGLMGVWVVC